MTVHLLLSRLELLCISSTFLIKLLRLPYLYRIAFSALLHSTAQVSVLEGSTTVCYALATSGLPLLPQALRQQKRPPEPSLQLHRHMAFPCRWHP